ncbi:hypothetical protein GCM10023321_56920 [Pseudonocardia eucalypti]|uniref:Uncharacterized protein n=1 Tax=Pseudonocardia eucalypti TaxID=648755 RepID=A0ABP9QRE4_9PSEU
MSVATGASALTGCAIPAMPVMPGIDELDELGGFADGATVHPVSAPTPTAAAILHAAPAYLTRSPM